MIPIEDYKKIVSILKHQTVKYFAKCLKIRDKNGNIIAFVPNEHQENIINIVEEWKKQYPDENTRPTLFIIIHKARQIGFSTVVEGIFFHELNFNSNKIAMVVSYDEDSAQNINDMSDRFYQYLPKWVKPMRRPARGKGILFENPTNKQSEFEKNPGLQCKFLIDTARNIYAGSSFTINYLHLSELAKWPDAKSTLTSLMQAVPQTGAIVVIESTANGIEYFHKLWMQAKRGELSYKCIFVGWHMHAEYTKKFENDIEKADFIKTLSEKELKLKKLYNLAYEQLYWRREMMRSPKINGDENIFFQEYPASDDEAFLTSGRPVFDRMKINERIKFLEEKYKDNPPDVGYIECVDSKYKFIPDECGTVIIYEHPKKDYPYVFGGDIAEGLINGDWSVTQVCDNTTGIQVAKQRLHIHPDLFALEQIKLARYYNDALIADEVNNHGMTTITSLQRENYWKQYKREIFDRISKSTQQKFGFDTKDQSRQRIIDRLRAIAREEIELINDIETLNEMLTFIYNDQGKEEAESDCFDDCVISIAIMYEARSQQSANPPKPQENIFKGKEVHYSVLQDMTKNPKLKEKLKQKYGINTIKVGGNK